MSASTFTMGRSAVPMIVLSWSARSFSATTISSLRSIELSTRSVPRSVARMTSRKTLCIAAAPRRSCGCHGSDSHRKISRATANDSRGVISTPACFACGWLRSPAHVDSFRNSPRNHTTYARATKELSPDDRSSRARASRCCELAPRTPAPPSYLDVIVGATSTTTAPEAVRFISSAPGTPSRRSEFENHAPPGTSRRFALDATNAGPGVFFFFFFFIPSSSPGIPGSVPGSIPEAAPSSSASSSPSSSASSASTSSTSVASDSATHSMSVATARELGHCPMRCTTSPTTNATPVAFIASINASLAGSVHTTLPITAGSCSGAHSASSTWRRQDNTVAWCL